MQWQQRTVPTKLITTFLFLILTLDNFIFNSTNYLETKGCTMGLIDDIFFIWTANKKDLIKFLNKLNTKSIKCEYQISKTRITFLDTEVYTKNRKLHTKVYRKEADRQIFLNIAQL